MSTKAAATATGKSVNGRASAPVVLTVGQIVKRFGAVADEHMTVVKRMRTKIAPGARIVVHGETDK